MAKKLKQDPGNVRKHDGRNKQVIRDNLQQFGAGRSIVVDKDGQIIAGNETYAQAKALGLPMKIVKSDGQTLIVVQREDLAPGDDKRQALAIADNRSNDLSQFDPVALAALIKDYGPTTQSAIGFSPDELAALFGTEPPSPPEQTASLTERFGAPPFSVLDQRQGYWQVRKKAWLALGFNKGAGREDLETTGSLGGSFPGYYPYREKAEKEAGRKLSDKEFQENWLPQIIEESSLACTSSGAMLSLFDPVLAELMYSWFCPPGGQVLDPFAGGSVRGIVAHMTGRAYWGCDLSQKQVDSNRELANEICEQEETVTVMVSGKSLRQMFQPCETAYIQGVCQGRCCEGSKGKTLITVHPSEADRIAGLGGTVKDGFLQPAADGKCPFKTQEGFCRIHGDDKPFGCKASPFTLNPNGTLIVRNRYRCLRCFKTPDAVPAHQAHAWSLAQIFGPQEAERITAEAAGGADKIKAMLPRGHYNMLVENDAVKHPGRRPAPIASGQPLSWVCADALDAVPGAPAADFIFSCPPYADYEQYSDDPRDLSNMDYSDFRAAYSQIIKDSVAKLKDNRFACFVVGDIRDSDGNYRSFVAHTAEAFLDAGLVLYNDAILLTPVGSVRVRCGRPFTVARQLGKTHQNVLVFLKGDARAATQACGAVYVPQATGTQEGTESV